eukprot:4798413-Prymnesium_polylepis.1
MIEALSPSEEEGARRIRHVQLVACCTRHATCAVRRAVRTACRAARGVRVRRTVCGVRRVACGVWRAACGAAACGMRRVACGVCVASRMRPHLAARAHTRAPRACGLRGACGAARALTASVEAEEGEGTDADTELHASDLEAPDMATAERSEERG